MAASAKAVREQGRHRRTSRARRRTPCYVGLAQVHPPAWEVRTSLRLHVELVYDPGCPNVDRARTVLTEALQETGAPAVWTEWNSEDAECPEHARNLGSPTILVNGEDVAPGPHPWAPRDAGDGPRCRIYRDGDELIPAPPLDRVRRAINEALGPEVV